MGQKMNQNGNLKKIFKQVQMERQHTKTYRMVQKQSEREIYSDKWIY